MPRSEYGPSPCLGVCDAGHVIVCGHRVESVRSLLHMATERTSELRVRLDADIRERLEEFAAVTRRSLTQSVNVLLDAALSVAETSERMDDLFTSKETR